MNLIQRLAHYRVIKKLSVVLFMLAMQNSFAVQTLPDDEQEINIEAGWSEVDLKTGIFTYHKPVVVIQGSRRLESDTLTISRGADGALDKIVATGNPARFQGLTEADPASPLLHASAGSITWKAKEQKLLLQKNAKVEKQGDVMTAPVIEYFLKDNKVVTQQSQQGRTKIVLQPRPDASFSLKDSMER